MSSNTSTPASQPTPPPPPMFSYAQAAKGRAALAATAAALPVPSNQPISTSSLLSKDTISATVTPSASVNGTTAASDGGDRSVNGVHDGTAKSESSGAGVDSESKSTTLVNAGSIPTSPSFGTASTSTLPDISQAPSVPSESVWDRKPQQTNGAAKVGESPEGRRSKKGKKQKQAEKEKEAELEAEKKKEEEKKVRDSLVAAPPPAVNYWLQRQEAQALKVKPSSPTTPQPLSESINTNDTAAKSSESKRKSKVSTGDDTDKALNAGQTGSTKDTSGTSKSQKKTLDGAVKGKEEVANKRAGPRGSRVSEKEEQPVVSQLPPPVEDAISWPTPETALEEEKRKALEKERLDKDKERDDRNEPTSNKPRPKEKWVAVPFVPSVNFNTPVPTRGGRGRGGARGGRDSTGRGGHVAAGGNASDRTNNGSTNTAGEPESRGRGGSTSTRATSLPPNSSKRPSSNTRPQGNASNTEKSKVEQSNGPAKNDLSSNLDNLRVSSRNPTDQSLPTQQSGRDGLNPKAEFVVGSSNENNMRSNGGDRRSDAARVSDQFKEASGFAKDPTQARDGRAERGRGGFRGRGGHSTFPNGQPPQSQHTFTNGHGPQPPNGYLARQNSNPYSPSVQQPPFGNQYTQQPSRGRGGSRSQSIPNNGMFGRFPQGINPQMAPLQTPNGMYDYQQQPLQTLSAGAYPNYDSYPLLAMVTMQLEYYFSIDNLCKDVYLRKHMDSQGFVFLSFIAGFKRIQALTQDIDLLRFACQESALIEVIKGEDGAVRLRRKDGWEKWVLIMEERDESVRTAGPAYHHRFDSRSQQAQQMNIMQAYPSMSPPAFSPNGTESSFQPVYGNGSPIAPIVNGNGVNHHPETPLSAAVPDFSPAGPTTNGTTADPLEGETTFGDEDVANLKLVFASPKSPDGAKATTPFHNASSRTFSNGSIDGRSIAEELHDEPRQSRGLTNGSRASEISPDGLRRSRSPFVPLSPTITSDINNGPPVMWAKGQRQQAPISKDNTDELYTTVRARALRNRETSISGETHPDMKLLYEFWSHFLCRNFNPTMYREFRRYAIADSDAHAMDGMKSLISYYDETLNNKKKVIPDVLASHYVDLVNHEKLLSGSNSDRPAFTKLRLAWRNGALDMRSRKKIDNLVDIALKAELER